MEDVEISDVKYNELPIIDSNNNEITVVEESLKPPLLCNFDNYQRKLKIECSMVAMFAAIVICAVVSATCFVVAFRYVEFNSQFHPTSCKFIEYEFLEYQYWDCPASQRCPMFKASVITETGFGNAYSTFPHNLYPTPNDPDASKAKKRQIQYYEAHWPLNKIVPCYDGWDHIHGGPNTVIFRLLPSDSMVIAGKVFIILLLIMIVVEILLIILAIRLKIWQNNWQ